MTALRKIGDSGDSTFTDQWNEVVDRIRHLERMRGGGTVSVTWINGVPTILGRDPGALIGIGKSDGSISNRASGTISIWNGTFGSESDTGDNQTMFNLGPAVVASDWVMWQVINAQYAFVKLCAS